MEDQEASVYYRWQMHEFLADGTLRIRTSGYRGACHFSGKHDVATDNPDFPFWLWLIEQKKPTRRVRDRDVATVHIDQLEALRQEFHRRSTGAA